MATKIATHADIVNSGGSTSSSYDAKRGATKSAASSYSNVTVSASSKTDKQLINTSEYSVNSGSGYTYEYYITIDSSSVAVGSTVECYAYFDTYYNDSLVSSETVYSSTYWSSDNSSIASVNSLGTVTGVSSGGTYINGEYSRDGVLYYDYVYVTVTGSGSGGGGTTEEYINISPSYYNFSGAGSTCSVSVSASGDWYVSDNVGHWLQANKRSSTSARVVVNYNTDGGRSTMIVFRLTNANKSAIFEGAQDAYTGSSNLDVDCTYFNIPYAGTSGSTSYKFTVSGASSFTVNATESWISATKSGSSVIITANANTSGAARTGFIQVYGSSTYFYVRVEQDGPA